MKFPDDAVRIRPVALDEYGNPASSWDGASEAPIKGFITATSRQSLGKHIAGAKGYFPVGTDILAGDRVRVGSAVYTVDGAPRTIRSPSRAILMQADFIRADAA